VLGAAVGIIFLLTPASRRNHGAWGAAKLPLGTFLCIGGVISALWGQQILDAYFRLYS
jgi:leader peptidase (prepilin peptidase)/N-methyltransferase